jgi:sigma-B regulation protein RsbU (phosphoserine phosphatase)
MAILLSTDDSVPHRRYILGGNPVLIGRHPECDVLVDDGSISRKHAKISYADGNYYIEDLDSRNGTFLNDQQVMQRTKLYDDSEIRVCDTVLVFRLNDQATSSARPSAPVIRDSTYVMPSAILLADDLEGAQAPVQSRIEAPVLNSGGLKRVSAENKLAALTKITYALSETVERDEVLTKILDFLFELFVEADRGFIILKTDDGRLQPLGFKTRRSGDDEQVRISRTIVNQVMESKTAIISSDAATDDRFDTAKSIVDFQVRIRSIMCAPLINSQDVSIGVIQLDTLKQSVAFSEADLETLVTVALQASLAIQKADLFRDLKKTADLKTDLALAHELQQRFLPQRNPALPEYQFFSYYQPMQQVGGDYYDYLPLGDRQLAIIAADVVGHGIAAALLMAKVSADSRFALATSRSAVEAVEKMNNSLSDLNIDRFVTLCLGLLDTQTHRLTIVNAGHMPPILRKVSGEIVQLAVNEAGLPLGIMEDYPYESVEVQLEPGDILVMYTDGINEAMNAQDEQWTTESMIQEIKVSQLKTPVSLGEHLRESLSRHIGKQAPIDDQCLITVGRLSQ